MGKWKKPKKNIKKVDTLVNVIQQIGKAKNQIFIAKEDISVDNSLLETAIKAKWIRIQPKTQKIGLHITKKQVKDIEKIKIINGSWKYIVCWPKTKTIVYLNEDTKKLTDHFNGSNFRQVLSLGDFQVDLSSFCASNPTTYTRLQWKPASREYLTEFIATHVRSFGNEKIKRIDIVQCPWLEKQFQELNTTEFQFVFHGTCKKSAMNILANGFNSHLRGTVHGQNYGQGEYFATYLKDTIQYGDYIVVCEVLSKYTHKFRNGCIIVSKNTIAELPRALITMKTKV